MRSILARFKEVESKNPSLSSYICFAMAVKGQGFGYETVTKSFTKCVSKDDYEKKDRPELIRQLVRLSK
jgi:hypothetical protein